MEGKVPKHLDSRHVWHRVAPERCRCGCARLRSLEDPALVWECGDLEPESHLGYNCRDRWCPCHVSPIHGEPEVDPLTLILEATSEPTRISSSGVLP